ncbi:MAG: prephenate dehydrogenase/arogenate dehydrogenase family protein [Acidimicrobiales bacterium]
MGPIPKTRTALIVGVGLIGGSIGISLRESGWLVLGRDHSDSRLQRAIELGAIDAVAPAGTLQSIDLTFVATPVGSIPAEVMAALVDTDGLVTDVGSVKTPLLPLMNDPRFIGGHPMAGSEQEGVDGARSDLFEGRTWVLTPVAMTNDDALATIRAVITGFGAEVVSLPPERHDSMVAIVSHVPHLTAASLMGLADERSSEHRGLMRLAAGGFRDMTRIAASHPGIWPDICNENKEAIVSELDRLVGALSEVRKIVATSDREALVELLDRARSARLALPARFARAEDLAELRIPVADQKGALAGITMIATELDISIADIEIAHSVEGDEGVVILLVEASNGLRLREGLVADGYKAVLRSLDGAEER